MTTTTAPSPAETNIYDDFKQLSGFLDARLSPHDVQEIMPLFKQIMDRSLRQAKTLALVQDAVSQLRLDFKYMVFDLEATRRERDELRLRYGTE